MLTSMLILLIRKVTVGGPAHIILRDIQIGCALARISLPALALPHSAVGTGSCTCHDTTIDRTVLCLVEIARVSR